MSDSKAALPSLDSLEISEGLSGKTEAPKEIEITKQLGDGAQATVYEAHYRGENNVNSFAVKVFNSSPVNGDSAVEREFEILKKLNGHENVIKASEFARGNGKLQIPRSIPKHEYDSLARYRTGFEEKESATFMAMEKCKQDFFDLISEKGPISSEPLVKYLFRQICSGVDALHNTAGYAHLDIKLENILVG